MGIFGGWIDTKADAMAVLSGGMDTLGGWM